MANVDYVIAYTPRPTSPACFLPESSPCRGRSHRTIRASMRSRVLLQRAEERLQLAFFHMLSKLLWVSAVS